MRLCALALAACLVTPAVQAASPARLDSLFQTRPDSMASMVRAHFDDRTPPAETKSTIYILADGETEGRVLDLGEHETRAQPWFFPPNWFVAIRLDDDRFGVEPAFARTDIELAAPFGGEIKVGKYTGAGSFGNQDGKPGLGIRGPCNSTGGDFEIIELHYDFVGLIDRFGATFDSEGCQGFVVYRRGTNDWTGGVDNGAPTFPEPSEPPPSLPTVVAEFAADDPQLADLDIPESPAEPTMIVYAKGQDWIARNRKILMSGSGDEVRNENGWSPRFRVVDLELRKPNPDGFLDTWRFQMMSPLQEAITTRTYPYAGNFPYQAVGYPGLKIAGLRNGCASTGGFYRVLELKRRDDGTLERFAADFEQHCEQRGPPMSGFVVYRSGSGE